MTKIKGKLPNKSMQMTNQGYYTDGSIGLLNDYVKAYDNTVNSAIQFNKDYGVSNKVEMQKLPLIKKIIEGAMRTFVSMVNSEDGFYYLQDTKLVIDIRKDVQARIFYNENTKDYTFIDSKYTDYLEQFHFKYVRLGDDNFSQVGIIDQSVLVGLVMPIPNIQNKYLM